MSRHRLFRPGLDLCLVAGISLTIEVTSARAAEDLTSLQFCTQLSLPAEHQDEAKEIADKESPLNFARTSVAKNIKPSTPRLAVSMAALWGNKWQEGAEIRVGFMNGDPAVQQKVEQYAHQWEQYANVTFKF